MSVTEIVIGKSIKKEIVIKKTGIKTNNVDNYKNKPQLSGSRNIDNFMFKHKTFNKTNLEMLDNQRSLHTKKLEKNMLLNYSAYEYLYRNAKANKGLLWIVSLRNNRTPFSHFGNSTHTTPPRFWKEEMSKWEKKLNLGSKLREEELKKYKTNLYFDNSKETLKSTVLSPFSTIDSILLKGDSSPVFLAKL